MSERAQGLTPIARKKLDQMGATIRGVLVKNEAGAWAAVSDAGRVMWLDNFEGQASVPKKADRIRTQADELENGTDTNDGSIR